MHDDYVSFVDAQLAGWIAECSGCLDELWIERKLTVLDDGEAIVGKAVYSSGGETTVCQKEWHRWL